ncbi:hypothetical protein TNCV_581231 [Trichonephila clavipes]|nr:hypothetical protein TNCV_581231 [Trichonephila clavipes]
MVNLSDQSFPSTNVGRIEEEMISPGRGDHTLTVISYVGYHSDVTSICQNLKESLLICFEMIWRLGFAGKSGFRTANINGKTTVVTITQREESEFQNHCHTTEFVIINYRL